MAIETTPEVVKITEVNQIKLNVLDTIHSNKDTITEVIREFKSKFDNNLAESKKELYDKKNELEMKKKSNLDEISRFEKVITDMKNKIQEHEQQVHTDVDNKADIIFQSNLQSLNDENQNNDDDINDLNKTLEKNMEEIEKAETLSKETIQKIQQSKTTLNELSNKFNEIETELEHLKYVETTKITNISELLDISEFNTKFIDAAVDKEFDSYDSSITLKDDSMQENLNSQVNQNPMTTSSQDNGKPNEQQLLEFTNKVNRIALERTNGRPLKVAQINSKQVFINQYKANAKTGELLLNDRILKLDQKDKSKKRHTKEALYDVSSSEVDISEFSMEELAAHVENLTAELRAL